MGFVCGQIHTGFIGGMLGGFLVGYTVLALKHYIRLPKSMQGLMPIMVLPVLSTIISGLLMMTLIGKADCLAAGKSLFICWSRCRVARASCWAPFSARWQP